MTAEKQIKFDQTEMSFKYHGIMKDINEVQTTKGDRFYTNKIVIPAKDVFTRPQEIIVQSALPLGREGEEVKGTCYLQPIHRLHNGQWFFQFNGWDAPRDN